MQLALLVYCSLLISSLVLTWNSGKYNERTFYFISFISIAICSVVLGMRENVGVDFTAYKDSYLDEIDWYEPGYVAIQKFLRFIGAHYSVLFGSIVFLQLYFYYKSFIDVKNLLPYGVFFFFTYGQLFTDLNIIRQGVAVSIILFSVKYIYEKRPKKFIFYILTASLFHGTSIIYLGLYFIRYLTVNYAVIKQVVLYVLTIFLSAIFQALLMTFVSNNIGGLSVFDKYARSGVENFGLEIGIGVWLMRLLDIVLILFYPILKREYNKRFMLYYKIFFVGILLYNVSGIHMLFSRLWGGLLMARLVVFAYLVHYCFSHWKQIPIIYRFLGILIIFVNLALFMAAILNSNNLCSPFQFVEL